MYQLALTSSRKDLRTHADQQRPSHALARDDRGRRTGERVSRSPRDPARHRARLRARDPGPRPRFCAHGEPGGSPPDQRRRAARRLERPDPDRTGRPLPRRPAGRPVRDHRRQPYPARRRARARRPLEPARRGAPGPRGDQDLLGSGSRARAPARRRPGHRGSGPPLHDPGARARGGACARGRRRGAPPRGRHRRHGHRRPRRRRAGPGDARPPAPRTGHRTDRARGELGARGEAETLAAPQHDGAGVPARGAHRPRGRRTRRAPGPAPPDRPHDVGDRPVPGGRAGAARPGHHHRARRLAEPEPVGADAGLQPATATAPRGTAQRVQPAPGAPPPRQDAVPSGDAADAGDDERDQLLHHAQVVHPAVRRRDAADDARQRERFTASAEEALRRAGRRVPEASGQHRDRRRAVARR